MHRNFNKLMLHKFSEEANRTVKSKPVLCVRVFYYADFCTLECKPNRKRKECLGLSSISGCINRANDFWCLHDNM
nr:MAG TPA: hypothetical protein [Caudoviricetes sp.]